MPSPNNQMDKAAALLVGGAMLQSLRDNSYNMMAYGRSAETRIWFGCGNQDTMAETWDIGITSFQSWAKSTLRIRRLAMYSFRGLCIMKPRRHLPLYNFVLAIRLLHSQAPVLL